MFSTILGIMTYFFIGFLVAELAEFDDDADGHVGYFLTFAGLPISLPLFLAKFVAKNIKKERSK